MPLWDSTPARLCPHTNGASGSGGAVLVVRRGRSVAELQVCTKGAGRFLWITDGPVRAFLNIDKIIDENLSWGSPAGVIWYWDVKVRQYVKAKIKAMEEVKIQLSLGIHVVIQARKLF